MAIKSKSQKLRLLNYIVAYGVEENNFEKEFFVCQAENAEHAREQTLNAYPDCKIFHPL